MTEGIHKLNITPEAAFDLSECLGLARLDKRALKAETEEYIGHMSASGRIPSYGYFRCDYVDEVCGRRLKLFLYKGMRIGLMQYWDLKGVCDSEDWSQEAEDDGYVRLWLESSITEFKKGDWVLEQQVNAAADKITLGYAVQGSIEGLPKEVKYAIEYGNNQEFDEAVSILEASGGKRAWRQFFARKAEVSRKLDKRTQRRGLQND